MWDIRCLIKMLVIIVHASSWCDKLNLNLKQAIQLNLNSLLTGGPGWAT